MHVQVPTYIVRNEEIHISNDAFLLYVRLCYLYFRNYQQEEMKVDHKKLMCNLGIYDTRTFKKRLTELSKVGLIHNEIISLPRKGEITILFNGEVLKNGHFTMMDCKLFDYLEQINEHAFRLLFYYKSHINKKENKHYCFVGIETLKVKLKMGSDTINKANELLVKCKLLKIHKHKIETTYTYDEKDELIFDKYNNHYIVDEKLF
jgi:hypothetical protein